jgi:hypothetical protein
VAGALANIAHRLSPRVRDRTPHSCLLCACQIVGRASTPDLGWANGWSSEHSRPWMGEWWIARQAVGRPIVHNAARDMGGGGAQTKVAHRWWGAHPFLRGSWRHPRARTDRLLAASSRLD